MIADFPSNYSSDLRAWIQTIPDIPLLTLQDFSLDMVVLQNEQNQSNDIIQLVKPPPGGFAVLAVDFEFHQEYSYDGFICVASVSSPARTLIVDCINENRQFARNWMTKMLTGKRVLKVFCGCANDVFRMQKDWNCFANGVVDIQDLFVIWRRKSFSECLSECRRAVRQRLEERKKAANETAVENYLASLDSPGLAFLMAVFLPNCNESKDTISSLADWRKRPLHTDLIQYSAIDSYFTLKVFHILIAKIGKTGLQEAAEMTMTKLLNRSSLPRYKDNLISTSAGQWLVEQILSWRQFYAKKPDQVLKSLKIPLLARDLQNTDHQDTYALAVLLEKYKGHDEYEKGAKLLAAYLERDGATLEAMKRLRCHNCCQIGHVAKFCFFDSQPESKKKFFGLPENLLFKLKQDTRRRAKYCEKHGIDPATPGRPWESRHKK